jgi:acetolactate synthase-1/2/3 large subunit
MAQEMKVTDYIIKFLEYMNVKYAYGIIGGAITHLFDSLSKSKNIKFIHCYHEQAAAFAASASAKFSGNISVALATSGPGATNLITGIADAYFDSSPVLFITGQVNTYDFKFNLKVRQRGFQETDIVKIIKPITKYSVLITSSKIVERELKKAILMALTGRKGPVLIDLPMDIQRKNIKVTPSSFIIDNQVTEYRINNNILKNILAIIRSSKFPIVLAGGGCAIAGTRDELIKFVERLGIPVVVSLMGKDSFPHNHKLFGGFIGAYGNRYGNLLLANSDLLIVLGSRLDSRQIGNVIKPFLNKKIIRIDIDKDEIESSKLKYEIKLICDVKKFLMIMNNFMNTVKMLPQKNEKYKLFIQILKKRFEPISEMKRAKENDWHYRVMTSISDNLDDNDIICVDVGQNQMVAAQVLNIRGNQRFINSGGMAPMGFALPSAVGLAIETKRRIIVITGDGGMQINIQELNNVTFYKLPIIIFVFNNKSLGMIKQFQKMYFSSNYFGTDERSGYNSCNYCEIAKAYGIDAIKLEQNENSISIISKILKENMGPFLVEILINYQTYVFPKLEYNKPIDEIDPPLDDEEKRILKNITLGALEK